MSGDSQKKILIVTGTRPNFVKVTQFKKCAREFPRLDVQIVHTGQHYDQNMSQVFFEQFGLVPDHFLDISLASPVSQLAQIMERMEELVTELQPSLIMVVGDVNSTLAGALVANKMRIPLAHLESGLRSDDRTMPEEINRILTDEITDHFFVTEESGLQHLRQAKKEESNIHFVGNTMIDTLVAFRDQIAQNTILEELGLKANEFALMTIHRPATVDHKERLTDLLELVKWMTQRHEVVFPIHPRTVRNLERFGLIDDFKRLKALHLAEPMGYFPFQKLIADCRYVLTDSGGIQEETTFLQKPCLTLRPNTERPVTIDLGTNLLIGEDWSTVPSLIEQVEEGKFKKGQIPPMWDGQSTSRILEILNNRI